MKSVRHSTLGGKLFLMIPALFCMFLAFPIAAAAQGSQGQDAVFNSSNGIVGSSSFIDASMFAGNVLSPNFCSVLNYVLVHIVQSSYPNGAVIDARGLPGTTNTSMTCTASPWNGITSPAPATILLPATSGATPTPIIISTPWIIPSNTHLIGEGDGLGSSAATTIQVSGSFNTTPGYIMQFGSSAGASRISVERLTIDGLGNSVNGIVNPNAGPNSYVDHVTLYQIRGTGLLVENNADGSGPYSNITFEIGNG